MKKMMKISGSLALLLTLAVLGINQSCSSARYNTGDKAMQKIIDSPQYRDGKFHNREEWREPALGEYFSTAWDFLFTRDHRTPHTELPRVEVDLTHFLSRDSSKLNVTWLGHSSLMINIEGYRILTDPVYEKRVSLAGPSRYNGEVPLNLDDIPTVDVVLISHNHYDHLNKYTIQLLRDKAALFVTPLAVGAQLISWGVPAQKIVELDWWEEYRIHPDLMVASTPSQHFSGRGLTDRDETLWTSYVVKGRHHKIYFSGDSGYFPGFAEIGKKYGPFDITFLETGAYNEKWHFIHMFPEETVQAHLDLGGKILHPIHWGTFNLSLHSWFEPMERLTAEAERRGVRVATPAVGETTVYGDEPPARKWWLPVMAQEGINGIQLIYQ